MNLSELLQKFLSLTPGQFFTGMDRQDEARGVNGTASEQALHASVRAAQVHADHVRQMAAESPDSGQRIQLEQQATEMEALAARTAAYAELKGLEKAGQAILSEAREVPAEWARQFPLDVADIPFAQHLSPLLCAANDPRRLRGGFALAA